MEAPESQPVASRLSSERSPVQLVSARRGQLPWHKVNCGCRSFIIFHTFHIFHSCHIPKVSKRFQSLSRTLQRSSQRSSQLGIPGPRQLVIGVFKFLDLISRVSTPVPELTEPPEQNSATYGPMDKSVDHCGSLWIKTYGASSMFL